VHAFNVQTHRKMNSAAVDASALNSFLETQLGFTDGVNTQFQKQMDKFTASDWIQEGGEREDDYGFLLNPLQWRFNRHFHDPLQPWTSAGLYGVFDSSIVWMQEAQDSIGVSQGWSWQEARSFYYAALTSDTQATRDESWADTFRAVGQIMHLIEDAGQPAHVRNDAHGMEAICRTFGSDCFGHFEYWVSDHVATVPPPRDDDRFDRTILSEPTGHTEAPVPVARLIDTDTYNGSFVVLGPSIGLAEFTNANFFSEDTISNTVYPFPSLAPSALVPLPLLAPGGSLPRQYYAKADGYGVPVTPLFAEAVFDEVLDQYGITVLVQVQQRILDENVWQAEADILLPKAVDYAQGALEYFFRGRFDFCHGGRGGFSAIRNTGAEALRGTFGLYYDDANGTRQSAAQWSTDAYLPADANGWLAPNAVVRLPDAAVPTDPAPAAYTLVFKGDTGPGDGTVLESGAVEAKVIPATQQCTQTLWQWDEAGATIVVYDLGPDGVPTGVIGRITPPLPDGHVGWGVAFDPTDGNLWYTSTTYPVSENSDGIIRKVTPDGTTLVTGLQVTRTLAHDDTGLEQRDFSAIDVDPHDPHFLWVSGWESVHYDYVPFYKVDTRTGQVVHTCLIRRTDGEPVGTGSANVLLAAAALGDGTMLLVAPDQPWKGNRVFEFDGATCGNLGYTDFLPLPPPAYWVGAPYGIAVNGAGDWVVPIVDPYYNETFDLFTSVPPPWSPAAQVLAAPAASAPGEWGWDVALGIGPEWPHGEQPATPP